MYKLPPTRQVHSGFSGYFLKWRVFGELQQVFLNESGQVTFQTGKLWQVMVIF